MSSSSSFSESGCGIGFVFGVVVVVFLWFECDLTCSFSLQTRQLSLEDVQGLFGDAVDEADVIEGRSPVTEVTELPSAKA